jgi:hypothetical protein
VAESYTLVPEIKTDGTRRSQSERHTIARDRTLAAGLLFGADPTRYGTLIVDLKNQYLRGKDEYPTDMHAAYSLLLNYVTPTNAREKGSHPQSNVTTSGKHNTPETSALTFAQRAATGTKIPGRNGLTHDAITCFSCNYMGHYATECPGTGASSTAVAKSDTAPVPTKGTTLTQFAYMMAQSAQPDTGIDPNWILLDSQSTISVFRNPDFLKNVRESGHVLRAFTNGGHQDSHLIGDFPNLGPVWFNENSIANILSLADVRKVCRVTMDSSRNSAILVHRLDGSIMEFAEHESGLYIYSNNDTVTSNAVIAYTMVATVAAQKKLFSNRQIQSANTARELYRKIGRPSEAEFQSILRHNMIRNCPVTPDDASRAVIIYGPDIACIKGKTTRQAAASHVPNFTAVPVPAPILEHHRNITLCVDFFCPGHLFFPFDLPEHWFPYNYVGQGSE